MKNLYRTILALAVPFLPTTAKAQTIIDPSQLPPSLASGPTAGELISNVIGTLMFVAGVACVLAIIAGGIILTVSAGDEKRIKTAKDTILYAVIGLIIAISAYAITSFVSGRLAGS